MNHISWFSNSLIRVQTINPQIKSKTYGSIWFGSDLWTDWYTQNHSTRKWDKTITVDLRRTKLGKKNCLLLSANVTKGVSASFFSANSFVYCYLNKLLLLSPHTTVPVTPTTPACLSQASLTLLSDSHPHPLSLLTLTRSRSLSLTLSSVHITPYHTTLIWTFSSRLGNFSYTRSIILPLHPLLRNPSD